MWALCAGLITGGFVNILDALKSLSADGGELRLPRKVTVVAWEKPLYRTQSGFHSQELTMSFRCQASACGFLSFLGQSNADITWKSLQWLASKNPGVRLSCLERLGAWRTKAKRRIGSQKKNKKISVFKLWFSQDSCYNVKTILLKTVHNLQDILAWFYNLISAD